MLVSLEPRLSVPNFVSQLFYKATRKNPEWKAWVRSYMLVLDPQLVQLVHLVMDVEVYVGAEMSQNVTL